MQRPSIAILAAFLAAALATSASANTSTLFPSADSYLKGGDRNGNSGSLETMRIQSQAANRVVIRFDQTAIQTAVGAGTLQRAVLQLFVEASGNWANGRYVNAHRLTENWTEGGVSWDCPVAGCSTQWDGGTYNTTPTDTIVQTNEAIGSFVEFDVTTDVTAFLASTPNYGWLIKKEEENEDGFARFTSREGIVYPEQFPRLVLTYSGSPATADECDTLAPGNPCVAGGGARASDCVLEWQLAPSPARRGTGFPDNKLICWEGDARCDSDTSLTNRSCTFRVAACINNADPRMPTCTNSTPATWEVMKPNPVRVKTMTDAANLAALEGLGGGGFGVSVVRKHGAIVHSGAPNPSPNLCTNFASIIVPLKQTRSGPRRFMSRFRVRATTDFQAIDTDLIRLECRPSTCGNGVIEADHEECDDGNRIDGDICSRGCQFEGATPTPTNTRTSTPTKTQTLTPTPVGSVSTATHTATATSTHTQSLCGNGAVNGGEDCDNGAVCFGGSNQGNACTHNSQCPGGGECRAAGGDGCAANCTDEASVTFQLTGAVCKGGGSDGNACSFQSTCVGGSVARSCTTQDDCTSVGGTCTSECGASSRGCFADGECTAGGNLGAQCYLFAGNVAAGTCSGGASNGLPCSSTSDCGGSPCNDPCGAGAPAGACEPKSRASLGGTSMIVRIGPLIGSQNLRIGQPDGNGLVPVAAPAAGAAFDPVSIPGLACACVRGEVDASLHGPNNSASGVIACGSTPIANDVSIAIDHNTTPPQTCFSGPNVGSACHNRCAAGGTRAGLPCALTGLNPSECPGGTTNANRQCTSLTDCGILNACNATNGPGICVDGLVPGRACTDGTQCLGGGRCLGHCTAGTLPGALCGCETGSVCANPDDCGSGGVCRIAGGAGGGFCAGPLRLCQGGAKAGAACFNSAECPGGSCPGTGNFLGACSSDADCPGSVCAGTDDSACSLTDLSPPEGSGDTACLEQFQFCTSGSKLGQACLGNLDCGSGGKCGTVCTATPLHAGLCNSPVRTRFSGAGGMGAGLFLSTLQVGTISDGGSCAIEKRCAGGSADGFACQVNNDCPGGGSCAGAICHGFCSVATTTPCLTTADCFGGGGTCVPGAMFDVPCSGTNPSTECGANAICRGVNPAKGFDGIPCTADDPPTSQGLTATIAQTTGTSHAAVADAFDGANSGRQLAHKSCYPSALPDQTCVTASTGTLFDCASLLSPSPSVSGVRLTTAYPTVDGLSGDAAIVALMTAR